MQVQGDQGRCASQCTPRAIKQLAADPSLTDVVALAALPKPAGGFRAGEPQLIAATQQVQRCL